jgi:hypothetical protein
VGFMGPYQGTVRERLVMNNILHFNSFIEKWSTKLVNNGTNGQGDGFKGIT